MISRSYLDIPKEEMKNYTGCIHYINHIVYKVNGQLHREDGPAIEFLNNEIKTWYFNDESILVDSQEEFESWLKVRAFE